MRRALSDSRGAVLVMALFAAILLVGLTYHLSGVGRAALEQQIMQDAADATAFSAAAVNARGMNILALLNLIMVAVLTILVALRLVEALIAVAITAAGVCCMVPATAALCCSAEAPLAAVEEEIGTAADEYQDIAVEILKGLHSAADVINEVVPLIALAEGMAVAAEKPYSPPSELGVVYPFHNGLPTREGSFDELCRRAGENVATPMQYTMPSPEMGALLTSLLGDFIGELTESFSSYFCGGETGGGSSDGSDGSDESEPQTQTITVNGEETEVAIEAEPIAGSEEERSEMAPRVLDEERYKEESTLRAILMGHGDEAGSRFSFAAAEYYSKNRNAEALWQMKWLSRLVRFPFDRGGGGGGSRGGSGPDGDIEENNRKGADLEQQARNRMLSGIGSEGEIDDYILH